MPKFNVVVTDRLTDKKYVHDIFSSRSLANECAFHLEMKNDGTKRIDVVQEKTTGRRNNPVPLSVKAQRDKAENLYHAFTGHEPEKPAMIDKPDYPDVLSVIGEIDGVMYTTVRDGNIEKYIHKFKKNARPLFCVSPDGKSIHMIGGSFEFGERGIIDK